MSGPSTIEWTEATWNPVTGCTKVSPGCDHCYAETFAERWRGIPGHPYEQGFDLRLWPERLDAPLHWRKPRLIFVNSMSDLFHARVPFEFVERVWATMAATPQHTYQILTKRPDRMQRFAVRLAERFGVLSNVWLGTSVESVEYLARADHLIDTSAAVRFISCEPLLGPLPGLGHRLAPLDWSQPPVRAAISWVIVGGESGPGARPMDLAWARAIRDECHTMQVGLFVKQLGSVWARDHGCIKGGKRDTKGKLMVGWPADLQIRQWPTAWLREVSA